MASQNFKIVCPTSCLSYNPHDISGCVWIVGRGSCFGLDASPCFRWLLLDCGERILLWAGCFPTFSMVMSELWGGDLALGWLLLHDALGRVCKGGVSCLQGPCGRHVRTNINSIDYRKNIYKIFLQIVGVVV